MAVQSEHTDIQALSPEEMRQFTIVGSGVIGLLTAHELAEQGHVVTVISHEGQPTVEGSNSTSMSAVGQILPWLPAEHANSILQNIDGGLDSVVNHGRRYYEKLALDPHETGVMPIHNVELVGEEDWPVGLPEAMHVHEKQLDEPIILTGPGPGGSPCEYTKEYGFDTFSVNTRKTVAYLAKKASELGVVFTQKSLTSGELADLEGVVINASGMGARDLVSSEGEKENIAFYKGHTIIIKPAEGALLIEAISVDDIIIVPREDGTIVAGALYRANPENVAPTQDETEELLLRLTELAEKTKGLVDGLEPELFTDGEVLLHSAGYRVELLSGGIRVEPDEELNHVLHAYGFGGIGWSVGPAFAKSIAAQAVKMHKKLNGGQNE